MLRLAIYGRHHAVRFLGSNPVSGLQLPSGEERPCPPRDQHFWLGPLRGFSEEGAIWIPRGGNGIEKVPAGSLPWGWLPGADGEPIDLRWAAELLKAEGLLSSEPDRQLSRPATVVTAVPGAASGEFAPAHRGPALGGHRRDRSDAPHPARN